MPHLLTPYRCLNSLFDEVANLAKKTNAKLVEYGRSTQGAPLLAVILHGSSERNVMLSANLHGPEFISAEIALGMLQKAATGELDALRKKTSLVVFPCLNPDGYQTTWNAAGSKALADLRTNARGVDLNRNFPLPKGQKASRLPGQGSAKKGKATYRGTHCLSETESDALARFLEQTPMHAAVNAHSFMGTLLPPKVVSANDAATYQKLCTVFSAAQKKERYWRLSSRFLDGFTGELEDFQHHRFGTWAITMESFSIRKSMQQHWRAPSVFWRFNPREPHFWVDNDLPGILAYFTAALDEDPPQACLG